MIDIECFYPEVRVHLPSVPEPLLSMALVRAAQDFCHQTWFVRRLVVITTVAGESNYSIAAVVNSGEEVIGVRAAQVQPSDGSRVRPLGSPDFSNIRPDLSPGIPTDFTYLPYDHISFARPPDGVYSVPVEVAVQPITGATALADELGPEWRRAIGYGALEWLYGMPKKSWADSRESARNAGLFAAAINIAKGQSLRNFNRRNLRMKPARFVVGWRGR
jgi:hypothetical protein